MLSKKLHQEIYFWALAYLCFSLPFMSKYLPFAIGLGGLLLNWIAEGELLVKIKKSIATPWVLLFVVFYLLHLFSASYSINQVEAHRDLILKLPLLLLPLVLPAITLSSKQKKQLFGFWIIACVLMSFWLLLQAYFAYVETGLVKSWFYMALANKRHPAYFSMYCVTAILFLFHHHKNLVGKLVIGALFLLMIFLLSSRIQMLALAIISGIYFVQLIILQKRKRALVPGLAILILSLFVLSNEMVRKKTRIESAQQELQQLVGGEYTQSTRGAIWSSGWKTIKEKWLLGYGIGDEFVALNREIQAKVSLSPEKINQLVDSVVLNEELMNRLHKTAEDRGWNKEGMPLKYAKWKLTHNSGEPYAKFYMHHYNYHNQFLQSWATSGILCLLVLLLIFIHLIRKGIAEKNYLLLSIVLLVGMSFLSESMLERQYGVIYFALILGLLFTPESKHA